MPDYFYTATNRSGKRRTECIQAASAQDALRALQADEYQEIVLHTDDLAAAITEMMARKVSTDKGPISAADMVALRNMGTGGLFLMTLKKLYQRMFWIFLLGSIFIWMLNQGTDRLASAFVAILAPLIVLPPVIALLTTFLTPTRKYNRMLEDLCWGRWNEVLKRIPRLRKKLPPLEIATRKASALSGLGRWEEALAEMEPFSDATKVPHWVYLTRLAEVAEYDNQMERALEYRVQAYEADPGNAPLILGYANTLLKLDQDLGRAEELIEELEQQQLSDQLENVFPLAKGLLELNRENFQPAIIQFNEAEQRLKPFVRNQPYSRLYTDIARAYKAIALAELGETQAAEALYQSALPRLQALNAKRTIERYQQAVNKY
ncbi:hypothetical protein [Gimesia sp.]|uniref:hypothetical protein n=1 Tax=Gimesia sp. TaxID=2024833 RepID=UPI003A928756